MHTRTIYITCVIIYARTRTQTQPPLTAIVIIRTQFARMCAYAKTLKPQTKNRKKRMAITERRCCWWDFVDAQSDQEITDKFAEKKYRKGGIPCYIKLFSNTPDAIRMRLTPTILQQIKAAAALAAKKRTTKTRATKRPRKSPSTTKRNNNNGGGKRTRKKKKIAVAVAVPPITLSVSKRQQAE